MLLETNKSHLIANEDYLILIQILTLILPWSNKTWHKLASHHVPLVNLSCFCSSGILRYRVDFQGMEYQGEDDEFFDLDDY